MAFVLHEPRCLNLPDPITEGQAALDALGSMTALASDLATVGIEGQAVMLVDEGNHRVALRAPSKGRTEKPFVVQVVKRPGGNDTGRRRVSLGSAMRRLGLDPKLVKGRHELTTKDDLIILNLGNLGDRKRT
jgi:hypothetical protein